MRPGGRLRAATPVPGWVLVEHPGPWGFAAADDPWAVGAPVRAAARRRGFRINLVRGYARPRRGTGACMVAAAHGDTGLLERLATADLPARLAGLLLPGLPGRGGAPDEQIFLVCTNGRRNADCARRGRPVAGGFTGVAAARTWETTHIGGCADAVNVVVLPSGIHYRAVTRDDVAEIVAATDAGRIALPWYRGRSARRVDVQVAEMAVRAAANLDLLSAVRPVAVQAQPGGARWVDLDTDAGLCRVSLRPGSDWREYDVVAIEAARVAG